MSDKPKAKHLRVVKTDGEHEQIVQQEDPKPVNKDVVASLEALLAGAKDGTVLGFAAALTLYDDFISMDYVGEAVSYHTVGALEALKIDILEELREGE